MDPQQSMNPELAKALKIVLKYEIQALLSRLAETGEESLVIVASSDDGTYGHLGSTKGEGFLHLSQLDSVQKEFLSFCSAPATCDLSSDSQVPKKDFPPLFRPHRRKSIPRCKSEPRNFEFEMEPRVCSLVDQIPESSIDENLVDCVPNTSFGTMVNKIPAELESTAMDLSGICRSEFINGDTESIKSNISSQPTEYTWREEQFDVKQEYFETVKEEDIDTSAVLANSEIKCLDVLSENNMTMAYDGIPKSHSSVSTNRRKMNSKMSPRKILCRPANIDESKPETDNAEKDSEISQTGLFENPSGQFETNNGDEQMILDIQTESIPSNEEPSNKTETELDLNVTLKKNGKGLSMVSKAHGLDSPVLSNMKSTFVEMGNMARCLLCNKILQRNNRTFHWRSHVGDKRYKCDVCDKAFTHPSNMRSHRKIHSGEKPFQCDLCERAYRRRDYLLQHMEKFHHRIIEPFERKPVEGFA